MITSVCWIKKDEVQGCALSSLQCFIKAVKTVPIILRRFSSGIGKERTEGWDPRGPFSTSRTPRGQKSLALAWKRPQGQLLLM